MLIAKQIIVAYPLDHNKLINVAAAVYDRSKIGTVYEGPINGTLVDEGILQRQFEGWEDEVQQLIQVRAY